MNDDDLEAGKRRVCAGQCQEDREGQEVHGGGEGHVPSQAAGVYPSDTGEPENVQAREGLSQLCYMKNKIVFI